VIVKLEFFIALAHERHFGRAAGVCGVTQPTLSAGIKQLEESFGVLLVNRGSRFVGLTAEGERALEWARRIVADTRAMRDEIRSLNEGLVGHLRIAAVPTALARCRALPHRIASAILASASPCCRAIRPKFWACWRISKSMPA